MGLIWLGFYQSNTWRRDALTWLWMPFWSWAARRAVWEKHHSFAFLYVCYRSLLLGIRTISWILLTALPFVSLATRRRKENALKSYITEQDGSHKSNSTIKLSSAMSKSWSHSAMLSWKKRLPITSCLSISNARNIKNAIKLLRYTLTRQLTNDLNDNISIDYEDFAWFCKIIQKWFSFCPFYRSFTRSSPPLLSPTASLATSIRARGPFDPNIPYCLYPPSWIPSLIQRQAHFLQVRSQWSSWMQQNWGLPSNPRRIRQWCCTQFLWWLGSLDGRAPP